VWGRRNSKLEISVTSFEALAPLSSARFGKGVVIYLSGEEHVIARVVPRINSPSSLAESKLGITSMVTTLWT